MADDATPRDSGTADGPMTLADSAAALERLASGNPSPKDTAKAETVSEAEGEEEAVDAAEPEPEADQTEETPEDEETEVETEEEEGGAESVVALPDGQEIPVSELVKGYLRQSDYTRKQQAAAEERKAVEAKAAEILGYGQQLTNWREQVLAMSQRFIPEEPERPQVSAQEDPFAWSEYAAQKAEYDDRMAELGALQQQAEYERQMQARHQQTTLMEYAKGEREKLLTAYPELKDTAKAKQIKDQIGAVLSEYGLERHEHENLADSRVVRILIDFARMKMREKAIAPAREKLKQAPPMLKAGKRASPEGKAARSVRDAMATHKKTGSVESAVAALMKFDL